MRGMQIEIIWLDRSNLNTGLGVIVVTLSVLLHVVWVNIHVFTNLCL